MDANATIGKCSYCGQKVLLERGQKLNCNSCGAPLRDFRSLHGVKAKPQPKLAKFPYKAKPQPKPKSSKPKKFKDTHAHQKRRNKKSRSWRLPSFEKLIDLAEDIVDVFD